MAEVTIDQALVASYEGSYANTAFIEKVMSTITPEPKNNTFFAKLRHTPKYALVIAAITGMLVISGTAYAAYQLWFKPGVTVNQFEQNQYGRNEALVTFQNCQKDANVRYEVKSAANLNAEQVGQLLRARCEMDAINKWGASVSPTTTGVPPVAYPGAFTVTKIDGSTVSLHSPTYNTTVNVTDKTVAIVDGVPVTPSNLKVGDTVTYVEYNTYGPEGGHPTSRTLYAIVVLQLPAEFYDNNLQNMVAVRKACLGNTTETCVESGSIDVYPRNGESNIAKVEPGDGYELQGRIVALDSASVSLKASSGTIYTFTAPYDVIARFNTQHSADYGGMAIGVGDMLSILYTKKQGEDPKTVRPNQLRSVSLMIEVVAQQDGYKKY